MQVNSVQVTLAVTEWAKEKDIFYRGASDMHVRHWEVPWKHYSSEDDLDTTAAAVLDDHGWVWRTWAPFEADTFEEGHAETPELAMAAANESLKRLFAEMTKERP